MNRKLLLLMMAFVVIVASCTKDEEEETNNTNNTTCNGIVCEPAILADESAATIPASIQGTFACTYNYAEPTSPYANGKKASFTLTANNELIVSLEGEECFTLKNPAFRYGVNNGNFFFKDGCVKQICYNVSMNTDGTFSEVNVQPYEGVGWYGQFVKD